MDLFEIADKTGFGKFIDALDKMAEDITTAWELPPRGVIVKRNIGTGEKTGTKGKIISYAICSNEPAYPATKEEMLDENRTQNAFISIPVSKSKKWDGSVLLNVPSFIVDKVALPDDAAVVERKSRTDDSEDTMTRIRIPLASSGIYDYIRGVVELRLKWYRTAADSFGCCDQFNACSDARKCVHSNRFYSTVCAYRHNLESGRVFYGKNRNV